MKTNHYAGCPARDGKPVCTCGRNPAPEESTSEKPAAPETASAKAVGSGTVLDADVESDICGLCGKPGADKYAHPMHWPGEQIPNGPLVHAACESDECQRAHLALTPTQRERVLRSI